MTRLNVSDTPKMLAETLSTAQGRIGNSPLDKGRRDEHIARLQRLIDECSRHRPVGSNGKHGDLHTLTCGCRVARWRRVLAMWRRQHTVSAGSAPSGGEGNG